MAYSADAQQFRLMGPRLARGAHRLLDANPEDELLKADADLLPQVLVNLGVTTEQCGKLFQACEFYQEALAARPTHYRAMKLLGSCLMALGDMPKAKSALQNAVKGDPEFADAHCDLGTTLDALGEPDAAEAHLLTAIDLSKGMHIHATFNLGNLKRKSGKRTSGDFQLAVTLYDEVLEQDPTHWRALLNKAVALLASGKLREATEALTDVAQTAGAWHGLSEMMQHLKAHEHEEGSNLPMGSLSLDGVEMMSQDQGVWRVIPDSRYVMCPSMCKPAWRGGPTTYKVFAANAMRTLQKSSAFSKDAEDVSLVVVALAVAFSTCDKGGSARASAAGDATERILEGRAHALASSQLHSMTDESTRPGGRFVPRTHEPRGEFLFGSIIRVRGSRGREQAQQLETPRGGRVKGACLTETRKAWEGEEDPVRRRADEHVARAAGDGDIDARANAKLCDGVPVAMASKAACEKLLHTLLKCSTPQTFQGTMRTVHEHMMKRLPKEPGALQTAAASGPVGGGAGGDELVDLSMILAACALLCAGSINDIAMVAFTALMWRTGQLHRPTPSSRLVAKGVGFSRGSHRRNMSMSDMQNSNNFATGSIPEVARESRGDAGHRRSQSNCDTLPVFEEDQGPALAVMHAGSLSPSAAHDRMASSSSTGVSSMSSRRQLPFGGTGWGQSSHRRGGSFDFASMFGSVTRRGSTGTTAGETTLSPFSDLGEDIKSIEEVSRAQSHPDGLSELGIQMSGSAARLEPRGCGNVQSLRAIHSARIPHSLAQEQIQYLSSVFLQDHPQMEKFKKRASVDEPEQGPFGPMRRIIHRRSASDSVKGLRLQDYTRIFHEHFPYLNELRKIEKCEGVVHEAMKCAVCRCQIVGVRYLCVNAQFNLCSHCFADARIPVDNVGHEEYLFREHTREGLFS
ncbi:hypothetical protein CYMTET_19359 [Cymbomonas tetramitiformis]|uniref:Uncharacterized protein n=1 Tax=Cymbomonas tetramitiformis TaxID=36881 RepID=A0AAE0G6C8_9CHLO|nr:hypothetical protein CYMTET_19359 [Cymbomonas tetramitiformis]